MRRPRHRRRQQERSARLRPGHDPHVEDRHVRRGRLAAHRSPLRRAQRDRNGHRQALRRADRGRSHAPDGHRRHPQRRAEPAGRPQEPRHPHRDVRRRRPAARREGRGQRRGQENRPRQDGFDVPDGFQGRLRLHRRQPGRADDGCRLHQRPLHHFAERPLRGHQLRTADRPHGPGLRRFARHQILVGRRRSDRLRLRRFALEGRQGHHRHAFDHQQGCFEDLPHASGRCRRRYHAQPHPLVRHRVRRRRPLR